VAIRHLLDRLYGAAAWAAALFMIGTLAMILLSVSGRLLDFHVRGTDAYAGYCMAAAAFLALELWSHLAGLLCAVLLAWFSLRLVWQSFQFNDISQGTDATPLWIPQSGMALGSTVFAIALADELVAVIRGERLRHRATDSEPVRSE